MEEEILIKQKIYSCFSRKCEYIYRKKKSYPKNKSRIKQNVVPNFAIEVALHSNERPRPENQTKFVKQ